MKYDKSKAIKEQNLEKVKRQMESNPDSNDFSKINATSKNITALYGKFIMYQSKGNRTHFGNLIDVSEIVIKIQIIIKIMEFTKIQS